MADILTNDIEYTLDNIIIGDSFKMIKSNSNIIYESVINENDGSISETSSKINVSNSFYNVDENFNNEKNISGLLEQKNNFNFCYFMKKNNDITLNSSYNIQYLNKIKQNLTEEELTGIKNSLFYDKTIKNLTSKVNTDYIQIKNRYYFINNNKFCNSNDDVISGRYNLFPTIDYGLDTINANEMIQNYISENYNKDFCTNSLKFVSDKSIPIYDLDYNALSNIDILKFQNNTLVDSIIDYIDEIIISEKYKNMNYKKLSNIKEKILYNSKIDKKTTINYDSILIEPIINEYLVNYEFNNEDDIKISYNLLSEIFSYLFINLSMDSFYRLLIPVGKINTIFNDKTYNISTVNDDDGKKLTKDLEEYTYYINVDNIKNLNDEIDFNYFYLKNFKNPHDEFDYQITNINDDISCHTNAYSFSGSIIYKILNYVNASLIDLNKYIESNHTNLISGSYIEVNDLLPELIKIAKSKYSNWTELVISNAVAKEGTWIRYHIFNKFFKDKYDKDLSIEPYLITVNDVKNYWELKKQSFEDEFKEDMINDSELSSYYLSGDLIYDEISLSLLTKMLHVHKENENEDETENDDINLYNDTSTTSSFDKFIKRDSVLLITKNLFKLSNTQIYLTELYNPGLYKLFANNILNKNDVNDKMVAQEDWYADLYKNRFSSKLNDYKNSFDYYYNHENIMKKDGYIYGYRNYKFINKSFTEKLFLTYNYYTSYDKNFLIRHGLENDILINNGPNSVNNFPSDRNFFENENNTIISEISNKIAFKINYQQKCQIYNINKRKEFESYISMLLKMREFEFMDLIDGEFKYKETDVSKSNIYSIELKNSNLNYNLISFNEMMSRCEKYLDKVEENGLRINYYYDKNAEAFYKIDENNNINLINTFIDLIHELNYKEILDITISEDIELLKKTDFKIPITSYKFYNKNDALNINIETKMEIRKQLEKAIRKSIGRYAPVNTTLWKIKYAGI